MQIADTPHLASRANPMLGFMFLQLGLLPRPSRQTPCFTVVQHVADFGRNAFQVTSRLGHRKRFGEVVTCGLIL